MSLQPATDVLTPRQSGVSLTVGAVALLILGLQPVVLGGLASEGRLTTDQIGVAATVELVAIGAACGLGAALLKPHRIRWKVAAACVGHMVATLATLAASGLAVILARGMAGVCAGVMLWLAIGAIARSAQPERVAAVFATAQTVAQLALATLLSAAVVPRFGVNGALACLAGVSLLAALACAAGPDQLATDTVASEQPGTIGLPAIVGLVSIFFYLAGIVAVWVYLEPLGAASGLIPRDAATAVDFTLAFQVVGGVTATVIGRRLPVYRTLVLAGAGVGLILLCLGHSPERIAFIACSAGFGFLWLFAFPFQTLMVIQLDPTRRAAMQLGAAQLLGSSAGPLAASLVVGASDVRRVLGLAGALIAAAVALVLVLAVRRRPGAQA